MPITEDGKHVDGFDCLFPFAGEVVGGSQRVWKYDELLERMKEMGVSEKGLERYIELRKYGCCKHGGAGIGIGRLMMLLTGYHNIRDCTAYPRAYGEIPDLNA
jgi:asparaginyl-tRNA synthetase